MAKMGDVTPDLWMENATGKPVGAEALLEATQKALAAVVVAIDSAVRCSLVCPPLQ